jgi:hypothetical protein
MNTLTIKKLSIAIVVSTFLIQPSFGAAVFGEADCGQWITKDSKFIASDRAWLLGYMSGLSVLYEIEGKKGNPLKKINSSDQIFAWMDNYCQKNPLKGVAIGGLDLFAELITK